MRNKIITGAIKTFGGTLCILAAVSAQLVLLSVPGFSAAGSGLTSGISMLYVSGARQSALGGHGVSLSGDPFALYANPAGLGRIIDPQLNTSYIKDFDDAYRAILAYAQPLPTRQQSAFAVGVYHLNGGSMELNYVDGSRETVTAQSDMLLAFGWGGYVARDFLLGYSIKYLSSKLADKFTAAAVAADIGCIGHLGSNFNIGCSVQNFGTKLKYKSVEESLPALVKGGVSFRLFKFLMMNADGVYMLRSETVLAAAGAEFSVLDTLLLRCGYKIFPGTSEPGIITAGVGLRLGKNISLDWAAENAPVAITHNAALTVKF